jgi:hypothetical protein
MRDPTAILLDRTGRVFGLAAGLLTRGTVVLPFVRPSLAGPTGPPLTVVLAVGFGLGMLGFEYLASRCQQRRNRILARDDRREYFVSLRPLKLKQLQSVTHSGGPANPSPKAFIVDDVLEEVAEALSGIGTLFVIGSKETGSMAWSPAAILLRSGELSCRPLFERLARGARAIVVLPGPTPGIVEELTHIQEQRLLRKTLIVMPPATGRDNRPKTWESLRNALQQVGWKLPEFREEGMVYVASTGFAPLRAFPFVVDGERSLGDALGALIAEMPPSESVADAIVDIESMERGAA